jgi:hypothetical protein
MSRLLRALVVVAVTAGVFAMHGMTGDHRMAMAASPSATVHGDHSMAGGGSATHAVPVSDAPVLTAPGDDHSMGGACVAILAASLLLLALWTMSRGLRSWRPLGRMPVGQGLVLPARSPPSWLTPSLSKLCVLRT